MSALLGILKRLMRAKTSTLRIEFLAYSRLLPVNYLRIFQLGLFSLLVLGCRKGDDTANKDKDDSRGYTKRVRTLGTKANNESIEFASDYLDSSDRQSALEAISRLDGSLNDLSEDELTKIISENGSSGSAKDVVYAWRALEVLLRKNPELALEAFGHTNGLQGGAGLTFLESALETNHAAVILWLNSVDLANSRQLVKAVMSALGKSNPDEAITLIKKQSDSNLALVMASSFFSDFSGGSSQALSLVDRALTGVLADAALLAISKKYSKSSPQDALIALSRCGNSNAAETASAYQQVYENLFNQNPELALKALLESDASKIQNVLSSKYFIEKAIAKNPSAVTGALDQLTMTATNSAIFKNAAFLIAQSAPMVAFKWVTTFSDSETSRRMLETTIQIWGEKDPVSAGEAVAVLPDEQRQPAITGLAQGWSAKSVESFQSAVEWSKQLSAEEQVVFFNAGIASLSRFYPQEAADLLVSRSKNDVEIAASSDLISCIVKNYASQNLEQAIGWVGTVPPSLKSASVSGLISVWAGIDAAKASYWLSNQPPGKSRDAGAEVLAREIRSTDPVSAKKWLDSIGK